ncbi:MAG: DoxX family protein [Anaerolineae bacterium]|nr:DoxX family protein [Anaerolineae bacterium]
MNVAIWIVQILLALAFGAAGFMKITQPREKLMTNMRFAEDFAPNTVKGIGTLEVLAAIGLILPFLTGILPVLTPLAAVGLILTMIGAIIIHVRRGEYPGLVVNFILLALAAFVVYGRFVAVPYGAA